MEQISRFIRKVITIPIILYRVLLAPVMRDRCRFYPSCSQYALEAIKHFGVIKGLWLSGCRLLRCHPWSDGGYDPVSSNKEKP